MTIDDFNALPEHEKVKVVFDAEKIAEKIDNEANFQLFRIENFYVEAKTSTTGFCKRSFKTYTLKELPAAYAGELLSIPIVVLQNTRIEISRQQVAEFAAKNN